MSRDGIGIFNPDPVSTQWLTLVINFWYYLAVERFDSPFGAVELTQERQNHIFQFHPDVKRYRKYFAKVLAEPTITRHSKFDEKAFILYRPLFRNCYLAIVVKTNNRNFILTAYRTDRIQQQPL